MRGRRYTRILLIDCLDWLGRVRVEVLLLLLCRLLIRMLVSLGLRRRRALRILGLLELPCELSFDHRLLSIR
jgi:hypothetical protein